VVRREEFEGWKRNHLAIPARWAAVLLPMDAAGRLAQAVHATRDLGPGARAGALRPPQRHGRACHHGARVYQRVQPGRRVRPAHQFCRQAMVVRSYDVIFVTRNCFY